MLFVRYYESNKLTSNVLCRNKSQIPKESSTISHNGGKVFHVIVIYFFHIHVYVYAYDLFDAKKKRFVTR